MLRRDGEIDQAEAEYRQTIAGWQHTGNRGAVANQLESFAFVALARGSGIRAARLFGAAEALRDVAGAPMTAYEREEYDAEVRRLHEALDEDLAAAWAEGREMPPTRPSRPRPRRRPALVTSPVPELSGPPDDPRPGARGLTGGADHECAGGILTSLKV